MRILRIVSNIVTIGEHIRRPLSEYSADELLARAAEYRRMAESAATQQVMDSLHRLAERFEAKAAERWRERTH